MFRARYKGGIGHERTTTGKRLADLPHSFILLVLTATLFWRAPAIAHDIRTDTDAANDWIEGLSNANDDSCCGNNDCYPLATGALRLTPQATLSVEIRGSWFLVPEHALVHDSSPDGRAWICPRWKSAASGFAYTANGVRCLLLPPPM